MTVQHLEILCEEPSAEVALRNIIPRILGDDGPTFDIYPFQGKADLLSKLPNRLAGYSRWLPNEFKLVILVDRDQEECIRLKESLLAEIESQGLMPVSVAGGVVSGGQVLPRIVVEELESWFFGDAEALRHAFPGVSKSLEKKAKYRHPDRIPGSWEALERLLQPRYFAGGYRKIEAARKISAHMDPDRNSSKSFQVFRDSLRALSQVAP